MKPHGVIALLGVLACWVAGAAWGASLSGAAGPLASRRDRVIARRVRGAIRADPFLARATPAVKVSSNRGVVRLVGQVRTDKERSSIAFKAGQTAGVGRIDDRVTIGKGVEGMAW